MTNETKYPGLSYSALYATRWSIFETDTKYNLGGVYIRGETQFIFREYHGATEHYTNHKLLATNIEQAMYEIWLIWKDRLRFRLSAFVQLKKIDDHWDVLRKEDNHLLAELYQGKENNWSLVRFTYYPTCTMKNTVSLEGDNLDNILIRVNAIEIASQIEKDALENNLHRLPINKDEAEINVGYSETEFTSMGITAEWEIASTQTGEPLGAVTRNTLGTLYYTRIDASTGETLSTHKLKSLTIEYGINEVNEIEKELNDD